MINFEVVIGKIILLFFICIPLGGIQAQNYSANEVHIDSLMDLAIKQPLSTKNIGIWTDILQLSKEIDYDEGIEYALNDLGLYYYSIGLHTKAIAHFQELYNYGKLKQNQSYIIDACFGLARSYISLELLEEADEYYRRVIDISENTRDSSELAYIYFDIGLYYLERENYEEAIDYFIGSKQLQKKIDSLDYFPITNFNIGIAYVKTQRAKLAVPYFYEYLNFIKAENDTLNLASAYGYLAWAYQNIQSFDKAFIYYDSSLHYSTLLNLDDVTFITYQDISDAYLLKEDYKNSLEYHKKYYHLKDSVVSFRTKRQVSEMRIKFETEEKEKELAIKQKEVSELQVTKQRILFFVLALVALIAIISLAFFKSKGDAMRKQQLLMVEKKLIQTQLKNEELAARKLQSELENKEKDLTNFALDIARKNEFSNEIINRLDELQKTQKENVKTKLRDISIFVNNHLRINEDMALLQDNINEINQAFYQKLDEKFDNLSTNDKYALGVIRLNLSNKDLATIKGISSGSAKVLRYRLRKKLRLTPDIDLVYFLQNL